jgi:hypothetical protein
MTIVAELIIHLVLPGLVIKGIQRNSEPTARMIGRIIDMTDRKTDGNIKITDIMTV